MIYVNYITFVLHEESNCICTYFLRNRFKINSISLNFNSERNYCAKSIYQNFIVYISLKDNKENQFIDNCNFIVHIIHYVFIQSHENNSRRIDILFKYQFFGIIRWNNSFIFYKCNYIGNNYAILGKIEYKFTGVSRYIP